MAAWRDHCSRSLRAYEDLYVSRLAHENQKYLKLSQSKLNLQDQLAVLQSDTQDATEKLRRAEKRLAFYRLAREEAMTKERQNNQAMLSGLIESTEEGMKTLKAKLKAIKAGV
ncbi:uncharacterized protein LOC132198826 [Neocloeon triangulifer]|uniref:uncharacterized protein LOC132198826 n=1 Tax=Neocloeon triangulifer TaxID=2078957 RepID=UPI00286F7FC4|nr:uncharacterized protein LOC132198826 [Neocloeon triangulifer]